MSKFIAALFAGFVAIVLPVALVLTVTAIFHKDMIDSIYKNTDDISDSEMPPTVTSFQSGPEVVSTIGGSGEGLNCSLPALTNYLFDHTRDDGGKRHLVLQRFRQACVFHDLCYRHGLATYGYNQNDCDRILQNEAFRLCLYIRNGGEVEGAARCQTDSKMILAGVSLGGADAYRAWDRSTYFEFESDPWRSSAFSVSRVVDHPFKPVDQEKYHDDPDQIILTFDNIRSNLTITCVTCQEVPIVRQTHDPYDVSPELRSVGIKKVPDALLKQDEQKLSWTSPVWLPPRRHHAAPHLLVDSSGKNHLIWMTRNNPGDTVSCIVLADAGKLLTYTLPQKDACSEDAASQLTMVEIDMFATSPLPMEIPRRTGDSIFAIGISAKKLGDKTGDDSSSAGVGSSKAPNPHNLSFCSRSASRAVNREDKDDDKAKCVTFPEGEVSRGAGLGAFQNFATVRPGQQILFARDVATSTASWWKTISQNVWGIEYSPDGAMLLIDVAAPSTGKGPLVAKIKKMARFNIPDRFDPMMPITRTRDDLRFLSLERTDDKVGVRMIDFAKDDPQVGNVSLLMNGSEVDLHSSWALRPVLVLETRGANLKTRLVFSRGEIAGKPADPITSESLSLETLVFERDAAAPSDAPFVKTGGATCTIKYRFQSLPDYPCYRSFDPDRPMRASAAAKMQASQLLVGHFAGRGGYGIAFPDFCLKALPIILKPEDDTFVPLKKSVGTRGDITRRVTCAPLNSIDYISGPIRPDPAAVLPDADWPLP
jgi:hypothetical protein